MPKQIVRMVSLTVLILVGIFATYSIICKPAIGAYLQCILIVLIVIGINVVGETK